MCVKTIVDASAFRHLRDTTRNSAGFQLRTWIERGPGLVVFSPTNTQYADELKKSNHLQKLIRDYLQRGLALDIGDDQVREALQNIPCPPTRRSDDAHVLALAGATGATVLFSCDDKLRQDFADLAVLDKVGKHERRSVPKVIINKPSDTTGAKERRRFLAKRKCPSN